MQPISTDDELRAHWVLSDAALGLLRGVSEQRQLTLCVDRKYCQILVLELGVVGGDWVGQKPAASVPAALAAPVGGDGDIHPKATVHLAVAGDGGPKAHDRRSGHLGIVTNPGTVQDSGLAGHAGRFPHMGTNYLCVARHVRVADYE